MPATYTNRAGMVITVESSDLTKVHRELKKLADGKVIRRTLNRRLKAEASPAAEDAKRAVRGIPAKVDKGLRDRIAAEIKVKATSSSVRVVSSAPFAKEMEGAVKWRHPTYGHEPWVTQQAHPTFQRTVAAHQPRFDRAAEQSMDDALREAGIR